ncbi:MAG: GAF domain-containing protein, partial [Acidimicrobiia bacterium]|nr:GAF domain-containing protein [Acidimicrobiia bacterium]
MPWRAAHALQAKTGPWGPVLMESPVQLSRQAAVAELGQAALSDLGLTPLLNLASKLVCDVLGVEFSALARRSNDDESLVVVAGCGWDDTVGNGSTRLATDTGSCSEYVMRQQEPVFVHDFASDDRFGGQQFLLDHDIVSGVCVAILEGETSFGVLSVYTSQRRTFTSDDGDFLRSIANIIGSAVRSYRVHGELEEHTIAQERRIRYQEAMATCAQTLLADRGEDRLETAIEALLTATQAASVFVERNVEDPELGLCSTTVADVAAADRPNEDLYSEYWEKVPWDKMPTSRSFLERGEPILLIPEQLEGVEGEFYA